MKLKYIIALFVVSTLAYGNSNAQLDLQGKWEDTDTHGDQASITFKSDSTADFVMNGKSFKEAIPTGDDRELYYHIDSSVRPFQIDFIIRFQDGTEFPNRLIGMMEIISDSKIRMALSLDGERPKDFSDSTNSVILERLAKKAKPKNRAEQNDPENWLPPLQVDPIHEN